jgi:hypothetical protein
LPDFSTYKIPKRAKIYQIAIDYTKWPQNIPNDHNIGRTNWSLKMLASSIARPSKINPFLVCNFAIWQPWPYLANYELEIDLRTCLWRPIEHMYVGFWQALA